MFNYVLSPIDTDILIDRIAKKTADIIESNEINKSLKEKRYSINEAAEILGVIPLTIRNHIHNGNIKAEKLGRKYFIKHSELFNSLDEVKSLKYKR